MFHSRFVRKRPNVTERLNEEIKLLRKSLLLDPVWYRENYADLRDAPLDVARHYLEYGAREGRDPHPLFDTKFYLEQNPDVATAGVNPLVHYILRGGKEGRDPHPLFDAKKYLAELPYDVSSKLDPLTHYLTVGWKHGFRAYRRFDPEWYLEQYPDVREQGREPLTHYLTDGWKEERRPMYWFDAEGYSRRYNLDSKIALAHYAREERRINNGFRREHRSTVDAEARRDNCFIVGRTERRHRKDEWTLRALIEESGLFDENFYRTTYLTTVEVSTDPLTYFLVRGWREGHDPCGLFDSVWYRETYPDVKAANVNPLEHYLRTGASEGRETFPCFDSHWYLTQYAGVVPKGLAPVAHYLHIGADLGFDPCCYFNTRWYLSEYPDVRRANLNPLRHYVKYGVAEGRDPSPFFDTDWYIDRYHDIREAGINPLEHFLRHGEQEKREPQPRSKLRGYEAWIAAYEALDDDSLWAMSKKVQTLSWRPLFSIVVPTYNTSDVVLRAALDSVLAQVYPNWELCIADDNSSQENVRATLEEYAARDDRIKIVYRRENGHISLATNSALDLATGDYVCLMDHDDEISPNALYEFALKLNEDPEIDFIYSDEDKITEQGRRYEPFFKPDWSPEALEACMYTAHFACYRASIVRKVGGFRKEFNGAQDYDFVLRFTEHVRKVKHIPKILYHWRAVPGSTAASMDNKEYVIDAAVRALEERVKRTGELVWVRPNRYKGCFDVRRAIRGNPKVSIIIPSAGRDSIVRGDTVDLLVHCVRSIVDISTYKNVELIIVHNGDLRQSTVDHLRQCQAILVHYDEPMFNISRKINLGAKFATGDYLLLLNDDTEVISPDWIEAMLSLAQDPGVGAVGAKLYFEDGKIQHAGVAFWNGLPDHIRRGYGGDDPGHFFSTAGQRNYLAVTGACVLSRRSVFEGVGGFDEAFPINYNDIDYCLKIYRTGLRIVYAAQAELYHYESRNRAREVPEAEIRLFLDRWQDFVRNDPYYSSYFDAHPPNFELASAPVKRRLG